MSTDDALDDDLLEFLIQFIHPDKILGRMPGSDDEMVAHLFGISVERYHELRATYALQAQRAAEDLLVDEAFADRIDRLPFKPGEIVVGYGDSITDDLQSWFEILTCVLAVRRPGDNITLVNAGISGETTSQMISRFIQVVDLGPDWIFSFAGTNDARRHGRNANELMVTPAESERNLKALRNYGATQTSARWIWMTPASVIEEQYAAFELAQPLQIMYRNEDLAPIVDSIRSMEGDPIIDLNALFGVPPPEEYLQIDGLHPSLEGQKAIVTEVVRVLTE
jgi:acyl-CoA thioesterase-1